MGYKKDNLRSGATMLAPCFVTVGETDTIRLTDLRPDDYDKQEGTGGEISVNILGSNGKTLKKDGMTLAYCWNDNEDCDPGWYDEDYGPIEEPEKVTFEKGDGLWVYGENGYTITAAGQVAEDDVDVPLRSGATPSGNPFAMQLCLADMWCDGYDPTDGTGGEISVNILGSNGKTLKKDGMTLAYCWNDNEDCDPGWYDEDYAPLDATEINFDPAQGFWVYGEDDYVLHLPSPFKKPVTQD